MSLLFCLKCETCAGPSRYEHHFTMSKSPNEPLCKVCGLPPVRLCFMCGKTFPLSLGMKTYEQHIEDKTLPGHEEIEDEPAAVEDDDDDEVEEIFKWRPPAASSSSSSSSSAAAAAASSSSSSSSSSSASAPSSYSSSSTSVPSTSAVATPSTTPSDATASSSSPTHPTQPASPCCLVTGTTLPLLLTTYRSAAVRLDIRLLLEAKLITLEEIAPENASSTSPSSESPALVPYRVLVSPQLRTDMSYNVFHGAVVRGPPLILSPSSNKQST